MTIFFTAAVRGGRSQQPSYQDLVAVLKTYGTVLNEHIADETISDYGETDLSKEQIYRREMEGLSQADLVVAEVTTPSLGVGYLVARALEMNKRVICLYQGEDTHKLSAMIKGDPRTEVHSYTDPKEIAAFIQKTTLRLPLD